MYLNNSCTMYKGKHKIKKCHVLFQEFSRNPRNKSKVGNQIKPHNLSQDISLPVVVISNVLDFRTKLQFPNKVGMLRKEETLHSKAVCFRFRIVVSLYSYRTYINVSSISNTSKVTTTDGEAITAGCGVLKPLPVGFRGEVPHAS